MPAPGTHMQSANIKKITRKNKQQYKNKVEEWNKNKNNKKQCRKKIVTYGMAIGYRLYNTLCGLINN